MREIGWKLLTCACAACLNACAAEEKVIRYKPFFSGIKGAHFGEQAPVLDDPRVHPVDPTLAMEQKIVIEHEDGTVTLISRAPKHVMSHVERFLDEDEEDVLLEQVIAEETLEHYRKQGKDPREYVRELKEARRDIALFFARMPGAEHTPTVIVDQIGNRTWVIRLTGKPAEGLRYTRFWVKMEHGMWKLLWLS